ncbi:unnamed protein product [Rhodiola kirilowii]
MGESAVPDDPSLTLRPQQLAFEFFTGNILLSDMCPADDIIVSGKLLPLRDHQYVSLAFPVIQKGGSAIENKQRHDVGRKRYESLSELKSTTYSNSIKTRVVRSSRSLDDRRHGRPHSSLVPDLDRNYSEKSYRSSVSSSKNPKSRWQLLIFGIGMVKFPPEMELRDIKNRQSRCSSPETFFPATPQSIAKSPASGSNRRRGSSWGLIKALTCKDHTSITVATSFVCMPHV